MTRILFLAIALMTAGCVTNTYVGMARDIKYLVPAKVDASKPLEARAAGRVSAEGCDGDIAYQRQSLTLSTAVKREGLDGARAKLANEGVVYLTNAKSEWPMESRYATGNAIANRYISLCWKLEGEAHK